MKKYLLALSVLFLFMATNTFSQSTKEATPESFKKQVVGKTFYSKNSLKIKFANDGSFKGELKSSKDGTKRIIKSTWTLIKPKDFVNT